MYGDLDAREDCATTQVEVSQTNGARQLRPSKKEELSCRQSAHRRIEIRPQDRTSTNRRPLSSDLPNRHWRASHRVTYRAVA
jgi:hypothetical protein